MIHCHVCHRKVWSGYQLVLRIFHGKNHVLAILCWRCYERERERANVE